MISGIFLEYPYPLFVIPEMKLSICIIELMVTSLLFLAYLHKVVAVYDVFRIYARKLEFK